MNREEVKDSVLLGDSLEIMRRIDDCIYDLIFLDPPYYLQMTPKRLKRWNNRSVPQTVREYWDAFPSFEAYDSFISSVLKEAKRLMSDTSTIWAIGTYHNIFRIGKIMQDMGFWILNDVVWIKTNPMPNWLGVRFTNSTETLIWATKGKEQKNYTYNRNLAKEFGLGKTANNVWVMKTSRGNERVRDENRKSVHPAQKPLELMKRIILSSTKEGDLILDPFAGVGTTGVAASMLGRNFTLIEKDPVYYRAMLSRFSRFGIRYTEKI
ncbi:DNA adenine modification methylase [Thermoplasma volcanium GSS1]|uniref:Type II methyltransferase n=2 Tax=Thermoplasma volcanium TaxID=50339 RepID=Q978I9_THEVO|nr:DNA adenine modification methylase [Thermoplasma volcanium GSS1]